MSSITLALTGDQSRLHTTFYPEIELDERFSYSCSLLDFYTYNSIPNINESNNKLYFSRDKNTFVKMSVPVGSYEINQIVAILEEALLEKKIKFSVIVNKNTMKCKIHCDAIIDFSRKDSIGSVFGFNERILDANVIHRSDRLVNIQPVNNIRIDCDLTTGSFHNGKSTHTIYEFSPSVDPGYKINIQPKHLIYLPVTKRRISELNISIVDQNGELVDFRGETITCRVHIKKDA